MKKREPHKDITLFDRRWRIMRFDAMTGSYILYQVMSFVLPSGLEQVMGDKMPLPGNRSSVMGKKEFFQLQRDCLESCREMMTIGPEGGTTEAPMAVVLANGTYGVNDISDNIPLVLALTAHALIFNLTSFFDEGVLKEVTGSFEGLSLSSAPTSTTTPTPP